MDLEEVSLSLHELIQLFHRHLLTHPNARTGRVFSETHDMTGKLEATRFFIVLGSTAYQVPPDVYEQLPSSFGLLETMTTLLAAQKPSALA